MNCGRKKGGCDKGEEKLGKKTKVYEKPLEGFGVHLAGLADGPRETCGSQIFAKTVSGSENAFRGPENAFWTAGLASPSVHKEVLGAVFI